MNAVVIYPAGPPAIIELPDEHDARYRVLSETVGGWLEAVWPEIAGVVGYINEEGKLNGLVANLPATGLMQSRLYAGDFIAGNLVVCGTDGSEYEVGLDPEQVAAVIAMAGG